MAIQTVGRIPHPLSGPKGTFPPLVGLEQIRHCPIQRRGSLNAQLGGRQDLPHHRTIPGAVANARMHPVALRVLSKPYIASGARLSDSSAAGANVGIALGAVQISGQREMTWRRIARLKEPTKRLLGQGRLA
jgi:hypothetical protein